MSTSLHYVYCQVYRQINKSQSHSMNVCTIQLFPTVVSFLAHTKPVCLCIDFTGNPWVVQYWGASHAVPAAQSQRRQWTWMLFLLLFPPALPGNSPRSADTTVRPLHGITQEISIRLFCCALLMFAIFTVGRDIFRATYFSCGHRVSMVLLGYCG